MTVLRLKRRLIHPLGSQGQLVLVRASEYVPDLFYYRDKSANQIQELAARLSLSNMRVRLEGGDRVCLQILYSILVSYLCHHGLVGIRTNTHKHD